MFKDRVCPFFDEQDIPLLRILTDRGTEYCGKKEQRKCQLYLTLEDTDTHERKPKVRTNGICEWFYETILNEFYPIVFRKRIYQSVDLLQANLDLWTESYKKERTHSGRFCYGKTPIQTFNDSKRIA